MRAQLIVIRVNKERTEILSESTRGNSDVRFLILTTMNSSHPPPVQGWYTLAASRLDSGQPC